MVILVLLASYCSIISFVHICGFPFFTLVIVFNHLLYLIMYNLSGAIGFNFLVDKLLSKLQNIAQSKYYIY